MPKGIMVVQTSPVDPAKEDAYNDWYDNTHIPEILEIPGFTSARRFKLHGPGADGAHTPGFHPECVPFLARERDILGVGVETVGTDAGQAATFNPMFPCHTIMHGSNKFGLASLTNLDQLPPTGAVVIAPPLKIVNGSGSPLRVLALVPA